MGVPLISNASNFSPFRRLYVVTSTVQWLRLFYVYLQIQKKIEEMAGAGLDTTSLDDEAFTMEAAQDRCILRLIASCCNGEYLLLMVSSKEGCIIYILASFLPV